MTAIYAFFNEDATVTLDSNGMRLTHQHFFFGIPGKVKPAWSISAMNLTEAREITYHRPAKNGGWSTSVKLHLRGGVVLEPALLGGEGKEGTAYRKLAAALERRLGDGFQRFNDFGPLGQKPASEPPPGA